MFGRMLTFCTKYFSIWVVAYKQGGVGTREDGWGIKFQVFMYILERTALEKKNMDFLLGFLYNQWTRLEKIMFCNRVNGKYQLNIPVLLAVLNT